MDITQIIGIALITTFAVLFLKQWRPELAVVVALAGGLIILFMFIDGLTSVLEQITNIAQRTGIEQDVFASVLKIVGIGYLTDFACGICADSGMNSLADKVALAGKVAILLVSMPIITSIIDIVLGVLP